MKSSIKLLALAFFITAPSICMDRENKQSQAELDARQFEQEQDSKRNSSKTTSDENDHYKEQAIDANLQALIPAVVYMPRLFDKTKDALEALNDVNKELVENLDSNLLLTFNTKSNRSPYIIQAALIDKNDSLCFYQNYPTNNIFTDEFQGIHAEKGQLIGYPLNSDQYAILLYSDKDKLFTKVLVSDENKALLKQLSNKQLLHLIELFYKRKHSYELNLPSLSIELNPETLKLHSSLPSKIRNIVDRNYELVTPRSKRRSACTRIAYTALAVTSVLASYKLVTLPGKALIFVCECAPFLLTYALRKA